MYFEVNVSNGEKNIKKTIHSVDGLNSFAVRMMVKGFPSVSAKSFDKNGYRKTIQYRWRKKEILVRVSA